MKKVMICMFIFALLLGGCSQASQTQVENKPTNPPAETKPNSQPKSDYPNKPIQFIVPYAAGGTSDFTARVLASNIIKYLPKETSVVIVNKPGGGGTIGNTEVYNAKPDGYTLLLATMGPNSLQPLFGKTVYSHDGFQAIARVLSIPEILAVKADAPWKTYEEWLDYVKKNPGEFKISTAGVGNVAHIAIESMNDALGIQTEPIAFDGGGPSMTALLGGHVQGGVFTTQEIKTHLEDGTLRALLNLGSRSAEGFENVPLLKDKGFDVEVDTFVGVAAPKGLPEDVLNILDDAFKKALEDPEVINQLNKMALEPVHAGPEEFQKVITDSYNKYGVILKNIGLIK